MFSLGEKKEQQNLNKIKCQIEFTLSQIILENVGNSSRVTKYSLEVLLFLFGTSLLFHVQF